jgi:hypothetical protein
MHEKIELFSIRCKKLPARLREYNAYKTLKGQIEDFQVVLPILHEFTKVQLFSFNIQLYSCFFSCVSCSFCVVNPLCLFSHLSSPFSLRCYSLPPLIHIFIFFLLPSFPSSIFCSTAGEHLWPPLGGSDGDHRVLIRLCRVRVPPPLSPGHQHGSEER